MSFGYISFDRAYFRRRPTGRFWIRDLFDAVMYKPLG